jgi:hypothetical protein
VSFDLSQFRAVAMLTDLDLFFHLRPFRSQGLAQVVVCVDVNFPIGSRSRPSSQLLFELESVRGRK